MRYPIALFFSYFCTSAIAQDTLAFKINSGGASSKNSISLVYSIGDVLASQPNTTLSVYPLAALPEILITGIPEKIVKEIKVSVFPNPVAQVLLIHSLVEKGKLVLFDVGGKRIRESDWPTELSMQDLPAGEYFLMLVTDKESIQNFKIIKQ